MLFGALDESIHLLTIRASLEGLNGRWVDFLTVVFLEKVDTLNTSEHSPGNCQSNENCFESSGPKDAVAIYWNFLDAMVIASKQSTECKL